MIVGQLLHRVLARRPPPPAREFLCLPWPAAHRLLRARQGWRLCAIKDVYKDTCPVGYCWLERPDPNPAPPH
jgi:hypothetical protein